MKVPAYLALAVVALGLAFDIGGYPLLDPDEGRNAEVAREMAVRNDYVLPRLNGLPYLDKPVLFFAATAAAIELGDSTETAVRAVPLLFTLATLVLVLWFGTRLYDRYTGLLAAIALGSMPLTLGFARTVIFDSALTLFVTAAISLFYLAVEDERTEGAGYWWAVAGWLAIALAVLTKGPIGLALPLMVVLPWAAWRRRMRRIFNAVALLAFVAVLLPWVAAMESRVPGFLSYALVDETVRRLTTDAFGRTGPIWYFLPILPAAALPWTVVVLAGWKDWRNRDARAHESVTALLLTWIVVPLVFFSLSQSKRPHYLLPVLPSVALLSARILATGPRGPGLKWAAAFATAFGASLFIIHPFFGSAFDASPEIASAIPFTAYALGTVLMVSGLAALALRQPIGILALAIPVVAIPFVSRDLMDAIGAERSARPLAHAIEPWLGPETELVGIRAYPLSLPFYTGRAVTLATGDGAELTSNFLFRTLERWRRTPGTPLRPEGWWRAAAVECERPRIFITRADDGETRRFLNLAMRLLIESEDYAVYGPCRTADLA